MFIRGVYDENILYIIVNENRYNFMYFSFYFLIFKIVVVFINSYMWYVFVMDFFSKYLSIYRVN